MKVTPVKTKMHGDEPNFVLQQDGPCDGVSPLSHPSSSSRSLLGNAGDMTVTKLARTAYLIPFDPVTFVLDQWKHL